MQFKDLPRGLPGTHPETGEASRALWLDPAKLSHPFWQFGPRKIFLGATEDGREIGVADNRHLITVAGSRAGKGTSAIVPNLLTYEGSVLVLDPKGENARLTAERRGKGRDIPDGGLKQEIFVLDPFEISDVPDEYRAGFNPLDDLDPDDPAFIDDCDAITDAMVVTEHGKEHDFWNESARIILRGFIAWVVAAKRIAGPHKNLGMVRELLSRPKEGFIKGLQVMLEHPEIAHGVPREAATFLLGLDEREFGSVMATVRNHIGFLSSPPMAKLLEGGARKLDLKTWKFGGKSVYLCLPAMRLHRHSRFLRLLVNAVLLAVESRREEPEIPALMILDEMHVLGRMEALETAAGLMAGYGLRIWSIWQDFSQLEALYKDRWETFLGNTSIFQSFGLNDVRTLKYVSERLGTSTTLSVSRSEISEEQSAHGFTGKSNTLQPSPLLSLDEVAYFFSRQSGNQLILYPGADPVFLRRVPYFETTFEKFREKKNNGDA